MNRPSRAIKASVFDHDTGKWIVRGSEGAGEKNTSDNSQTSPKKKESKSKMRASTRASANPGKGRGKGRVKRRGTDLEKTKSPSPLKTRRSSDVEDDGTEDCSKENPPPSKKKRSTSPASDAASSSCPEAVAGSDDESDVKGQNIVSSHSKYIRVTSFMLHLRGSTIFHVTMSCNDIML